MNGTLSARGRSHLFRSSSSRPLSAPSTGFSRWGCPGDPVWDYRCRESAFLAIAWSGGTSRPLPERAFPAVAYSSGIQSRLEYSPNRVFYGAYHTTTGESRRKTNNGLDKKFRPFAAALPSASARAAESRRQLRANTLARGWRDRWQENSRHHASYHLVNQKKD